MKKTFTLALSLLTVCLSAQNIDYANAKVDYTRLPLTPMNKSIANYQVLVIADYVQKIEQQKAAYAAASAKAETEYQKEAKKYWVQRKTDSIAYENNLNVWFRLTPQQQAVTPRPQLAPPSPPAKNLAPEPVYEKTFNTDLLATTAIRLEGFARLPEKALIIQLNLTGFESEEAKPSTKKIQVKRADGKMVDSTVYVYSFNYRHIIKTKLIQPDGKFLIDEAFGPSLNFSNYTSKTFFTAAEADNFWKASKAQETATIQESIVNDNLKLINDQLNSNYGYVPVSRNIMIAWVNEKKNYDDFKEALNNAKNGYAVIGKKETQAQGEEYLRKAIAGWEKALAESNPKNRKARVDEDVTESLLMNLSEAYVWLNDFTKAQEYLTKLDGFKLSHKENGLKNSTKAFLAEQTPRVLANKK
jgi:hypothetical protein